MQRSILILCVSLFIFCGCSMNAYQNIALPNGNTSNTNMKASYIVENRVNSNKDTLFILALSGGGSRAAYFSSLVMLSLEKYKLLNEVDVISSVSGGSLPAAYYAISKDKDNANSGDRVWDDETIKNLISKNYILRWLGNWFWPSNMMKYWVTAYNRSDIMSQTFADNMFDNTISGIDYTFNDINNDRPNIIINSTNATTGKFSKVFSFTKEDFDGINSNIGEYRISDAVMSSASFPGVFNFMNLKDYAYDKYVHVFDGGNSDNLGLKSVFIVLQQNKEKYKKIVVVLVDSFIDSSGISKDKADGRSFLDHFIDSNFMDSFDSLLSANRMSNVENMVRELKGSYYAGKQVIFYHIKFDNVKMFESDIAGSNLYGKLQNIKTDFKINDDGITSLEVATKFLMQNDNVCLDKINNIVSGTNRQRDSVNSIYCTWPQVKEDKTLVDIGMVQ